MVIVIVGLLAVAALPRFLDVTDSAKKASVEGVAGGYATGVLSARAQWEAESRPSITLNTETYNSVNYDGVEFWLTRAKNASNTDTGFRDGYPWAVRKTGDTSFSYSADRYLCRSDGKFTANPPAVEAATTASGSDNVKYQHKPRMMNAVLISKKSAVLTINLYMKLKLVALLSLCNSRPSNG